MARSSRGTGRSGRGRAGTYSQRANDLKSVQGLFEYAKSNGLLDQAEGIVNKRPKLGTLQRLGSLLGGFNPAEAIMVGREKGLVAGVLAYPKSIATGLASGITGRQYGGERRYGSDIAEAYGIENKIAKFGIGFAFDVLADPTTYFGGAIAKGVLATVRGGTNIALKTVGKLAPKVEEGLRMAGTGAQDALGRAFVAGYKASGGAMGDLLSAMGIKSKRLTQSASDQLANLGVKGLTEAQRLEVGLKLATAKQSEFLLGENLAEDALTRVNKLFPDMKVKNAKQAEDILAELENVTQKQVADIRARIDEIVKPFFAERASLIKKGTALAAKTGLQLGDQASFAKVDELSLIVDKLKQELNLLRGSAAPKKTVAQAIGGAVTKSELSNVNKSLIRYEEERLVETIDSLSKKIETYRSKPLTAGKVEKIPRMTPQEVIVYGERLIKKLQKDLETKNRLLTIATHGRVTSTALINEARRTGDFSKIAQLDQDLAEKLNIKFENPIQQEYFLKQQARSKEFAKRADIKDPYAYYFPFIRKDVVDKFMADVEKTGIKVGSEGYRKEFKNILKPENIETDPAKAFLTREEQIINDEWARETLTDFVKKYGKSIDEFPDEYAARQAGYRVLKEKGGFGKPIGYVGEWDAKLFTDLIRPEFQTLSMLARATGFDAVTGLFKRSVTGLFLPFHVRNFMSGIIQNFETLGVRSLLPKNIAIGWKLAYHAGKGDMVPNAAKILKVAGQEKTMGEVFEAFTKKFSDDTFYHEDFNQALTAEQGLLSESGWFSKARLKETAKTVGFGREAIPFKAARVVGQFVEHQQKATAYITALSMGNTIEESLKFAEKAGFDYRALTGFESQVMRRIIPFYSFTRKNIELQLRTLGENPQRINQVIRFFANNPLQLVGIGSGGELTPEERAALPDFIKESMGPQLEDTPDGLKQFVSSFGTPIEAFTSLFGSNQVLRGISMMHPAFKTTLEIGFGKDSFRKRDLQEVYDAKEYSGAPQIVKDLLDIRAVQKDVLKKLPNGKLIKVGERTQYVADPVKLLIARSLFTSRGITYMDQLFDNDTTKLLKYIRLSTGVKAQEIDAEMQVGIKEKQQRRALEDLLIRQTDLKKFETVYEQK